MKKTEVDSIHRYLLEEGFTDKGLMEDLADHLLTEIELKMDKEGVDFSSAFEEAKDKLLPTTPHQLERDLKLLTTQKHSIMIKKIAYAGGYLSALCLCFAILFFSQSLLGAKKTKLKTSAMEVEFYRANLENRTAEDRKPLYDEMNTYSVQQMIDQSEKFERAELLLMIAIILFSITYLPFQFYYRYQKSSLTLETS